MEAQLANIIGMINKNQKLLCVKTLEITIGDLVYIVCIGYGLNNNKLLEHLRYLPTKNNIIAYKLIYNILSLKFTLDIKYYHEFI